MKKSEDVKELLKLVLTHRRLDIVPILCDALDDSYVDSTILREKLARWEGGTRYWRNKPEVRGKRSRWEQVASWDRWLWGEVRHFFGSKKQHPNLKAFYRKPVDKPETCDKILV